MSELGLKNKEVLTGQRRREGVRRNVFLVVN